MSPTPNPGRVAGLWYLLLVLLGPLRLVYIPTKLFVHGNAAATVNNIGAHELRLRCGIGGDLGGAIPAPIYFVSVVTDAGALMIAHGADFLSVFDKPQQDALALLLLRLHDQQNTAAEILWGLWLIPLAILVYRSRFLPRFLGVWLVINGVAYVILCLTGELFPQYYNQAFVFSQPALLGEIALMLWLVIKGSKAQPQNAAALSSAVAEAP